MNREILLQSLEDFMQETDARLTSLEAKPQVPEPAVDWKAFAAKATDENRRLTAEVERLTVQRNNLAAEVYDLRNVNAGLRKDNERLAAEVSLRTEEIESVQTDCETHKAQRDALRIAMSDAATAIRRLTDDNTRQHELVAALRQNSADLVIAIQALQAETA